MQLRAVVSLLVLLSGCFDRTTQENIDPTLSSIEVVVDGDEVDAEEIEGVIAAPRNAQVTIRSVWSDADADPIALSWTQLLGDTVGIDGLRGGEASFQTPARSQSLVFEINADDGHGGVAAIRVNFAVANTPPQAIAPGPSEVANNDTLRLEGDGRDDDQHAIVGYQWQVISGPAPDEELAGMLSGEATRTPLFTPTVRGDYVLSLVVTDELGASSAPVTVDVVSTNNAPTVGEIDVTPNDAPSGTLVTLTASGALDIDGDNIVSYDWRVAASPDGAVFELTEDGTDTATFTAFGRGAYLLAVTAFDGESESEAVQAVVRAANGAPTVDSGLSVSTPNGELVELIARAEDPDGDPLRFDWTVDNGPAGFTTSGANSEVLSFTPGAVGTYSITLEVDDGEDQASTTYTVSATNRAPIVVAPEPRDVPTGAATQIVLPSAVDPDGDGLTFTWTRTAGPAGTFDDASAAAPFFTPTERGGVTLQVAVSDGNLETTALVQLTALNNDPRISFLNTPYSTQNNAALQLEAVADDDGGEPLTVLSWSVRNAPGSFSIVADDTLTPTFTPNAKGTYLVELLVTDGETTGQGLVNVSATNNAPTVEAPPDRTVANLEAVAVEAFASDGDGDILSVRWRTEPPAGPVTIVGATTLTPTVTPTAKGAHTLVVEVDDGDAPVVAASFVLTANNNLPTADAGPDRIVDNLDVVTLLGSGEDPDGDVISTFQWTVVAAPAGSTATLSPATAANTTFTPDRKGEYTLQLRAGDAGGLGDPALVTLTSLNNAPDIAGVDTQGPNQSTIVVTANATDADGAGDIAGIVWNVQSSPTGSTFSLVGADTDTLNFSPNGKGTYVLEVTVTDDDGASDSDLVFVTAQNRAPTALPGGDRTVENGTVVQLAAGGTDPDGDTLSFLWTLTPNGGSFLSGETSATPTLTLASKGAHILTLVVNDGEANSASAQLVVTSTNREPTADPGPDQDNVVGGELVFLDATASADPDGDALAYNWIEQTATGIGNLVGATPSFVAPGTAATIRFRLEVDDGDGGVDFGFVNIDIGNVAPTAVAGADQGADVGATVNLNGSGSFDQDGDTLTVFQWQQVAGPTVILTGASTPTPSFTAPAASSSEDELTFSLRVNDGNVFSTLDFVNVKLTADEADFIFVSPTGDDISGDGTKAAPFRSPLTAEDFIFNNGLTADIAFAIGIYPDGEILGNGQVTASFVGGFDEATWRRIDGARSIFPDGIVDVTSPTRAQRVAGLRVGQFFINQAGISLVVEECEITTTEEIHAILVLDSAQVTLRDLDVDVDRGHGIIIDSSSEVRVENTTISVSMTSDFSTIHGTAISVVGDSRDVTIDSVHASNSGTIDGQEIAVIFVGDGNLPDLPQDYFSASNEQPSDVDIFNTVLSIGVLHNNTFSNLGLRTAGVGDLRVRFNTFRQATEGALVSVDFQTSGDFTGNYLDTEVLPAQFVGGDNPDATPAFLLINNVIAPEDDEFCPVDFSIPCDETILNSVAGYSGNIFAECGVDALGHMPSFAPCVNAVPCDPLVPLDKDGDERTGLCDAGADEVTP